jgi:hypothetical protein
MGGQNILRRGCPTLACGGEEILNEERLELTGGGVRHAVLDMATQIHITDGTESRDQQLGALGHRFA